jgi:hypothetical protein
VSFDAPAQALHHGVVTLASMMAREQAEHFWEIRRRVAPYQMASSATIIASLPPISAITRLSVAPLRLRGELIDVQADGLQSTQTAARFRMRHKRIATARPRRGGIERFFRKAR